MRAYHRPFLDAAAIGFADRVLDIGCGTGQTTRDAARLAPAGWALGVDLSARMLEVARRLAEREGLANVEFLQADAQIHPFPERTFDVAISRTGAMFFGDPLAAFSNVARGLRPGGRLTLLVWQEPAPQEWITSFLAALAAGRQLPPPPPQAPGPFSLGDPARVRGLLTRAGFTEPRLASVSAPMYFGADADDALRFVSGLLDWTLHGLDEERRAQALGALRASTQAHQTPDGVAYDSAAWIITAHRRGHRPALPRFRGRDGGI